MAAARFNLEANGVENVFIARVSSEEFSEAWSGGRQMRRLEGVKLRELGLETALVDPPRCVCNCFAGF